MLFIIMRCNLRKFKVYLHIKEVIKKRGGEKKKERRKEVDQTAEINMQNWSKEG